MSAPPGDPVLRRREQVRRAASVGQRAGYATFGVAMVVFVVAFTRGFSELTTTIITACLIVGSLLLAPAIVAGYAVKAAEREEREGGSHRS